jgi:hypothetical protein
VFKLSPLDAQIRGLRTRSFQLRLGLRDVFI